MYVVLSSEAGLVDLAGPKEFCARCGVNVGLGKFSVQIERRSMVNRHVLLLFLLSRRAQRWEEDAVNGCANATKS